VGLLLWFAPVTASIVTLLLLLPVNPFLSIVAATAAYLLVASRVFGGGGGTGDDRYNDVGGPFEV
jgi:hypothetical protein